MNKLIKFIFTKIFLKYHKFKSKFNHGLQPK